MKTAETKTSAEKEICVEKEIITAQDVMALLEGKRGQVRLELSPVKKAGVRLAEWVLALITVISLTLIGGWVAVTLAAPSQSSMVLDGSIKLLEAVVPKLLPVLTLLIGYLFGRGEQNKSE